MFSVAMQSRAGDETALTSSTKPDNMMPDYMFSKNGTNKLQDSILTLSSPTPDAPNITIVPASFVKPTNIQLQPQSMTLNPPSSLPAKSQVQQQLLQKMMHPPLRGSTIEKLNQETTGDELSSNSGKGSSNLASIL